MFSTLMMDAPEYSIFHRRCFLVLMVGAPRSLAPSPRGSTTGVLQLSDSCSQTSCNASHGATTSRMFLSKFFSSPCTAKDIER
jgi:hypothetical protein